MISVRHASASGRLDESWSLDGHRIEASVRMGALSVPVSVDVCTAARPRLGAYTLARVDGETWAILPERHVRVWPGDVSTVSVAIVPLAMGDHLTLTNTPADVDAELDRL